MNIIRNLKQEWHLNKKFSAVFFFVFVNVLFVFSVATLLNVSHSQVTLRFYQVRIKIFSLKDPEFTRFQMGTA